MVGTELRKGLESLPVMNANLLEFCLAHTWLIPEDWKGKAVFFWGTVYRDGSGSLYVRYLYWSGERWYWDSYWLGNAWGDDSPAALLGK
jgi:hypothetical protein